MVVVFGGMQQQDIFTMMICNNGGMVELVDTLDLKSSGHCGCAGSSPAPGTLKSRRIIVGFFYAGSEALTNSKYDMYSNFQGEDCKSFFT